MGRQWHFSWDEHVLHDVVDIRSGALTVVAKIFTTLGTGFVVYPLLIAAGLLLWRRTGRWRLPLLCVGWLTVGQLVRIAINHGVGRARPPPSLHLVGTSGYAFPSGHTTNATIGYGLIALLLTLCFPARRLPIIVSAAVIAVCVGLSRVYLGVHWPTDVLAGWVLGLLWLSVVRCRPWHSLTRRWSNTPTSSGRTTPS